MKIQYLYLIVVLIILVIAALGWSLITPSGAFNSFDFSLTDNPSRGSVNKGQASSTTIGIIKRSNSPEVGLAVSGCPSYASCILNPDDGMPTFYSTLTITTTANTPIGTWAITVTGSGGGLIRTTTYTLTVNKMPCTCNNWINGNCGGSCQSAQRQWTRTCTPSGCDVTSQCVDDMSCLTCSDGTVYGQCSSTKPKYCNNGKLFDSCLLCSCPSGQSCNASTGSCYTPQPTCSDGTLYGACSVAKPEYCDINGNFMNKCSQCGCSSDQTCQSDETCISNKSEFKQSEALYDINKETGMQDWYCSYDETRNKIAIIIKENGIYDNQELIDVFNNYFNSVKNHLNIDSAGVKKFNGSTVNEMDSFIENLVKNEYVGYVTFVGEDLPIVKPFGNELLLDYDSIDNNYSYVGRNKVTWTNECIDVATSNVIPPLNYSNEDKKSFIRQVFGNFINYHSNPQATFNKFNQTILVIEHYEFASMSINNSPSRFDSYNTIYFHNPIYVLDNESSRVKSEMRNKPLILMYNTHGSSHYLGLGLNNATYNSNQEILDFYNSNGQISLFVDEIAACGTMVMSENDNTFCCWPQTWLKVGNWVITSVLAEPDHNNFERWLSVEKVVGKALRKTWHNQDMIYGDILATMP